MTIAELDSRGVHLSWMMHAGYNPDQHRWYFCDGMLYECIRDGPRRAGPWWVFEVSLTRTGNEWPG